MNIKKAIPVIIALIFYSVLTIVVKANYGEVITDQGAKTQIGLDANDRGQPASPWVDPDLHAWLTTATGPAASGTTPFGSIDPHICYTLNVGVATDISPPSTATLYFTRLLDGEGSFNISIDGTAATATDTPFFDKEAFQSVNVVLTSVSAYNTGISTETVCTISGRQ